MATGVIVWSETAASNASADSAVNWAEAMAPSAVNDSARAGMASVARWRDDLNATLLASGVSTALTLTTNQVQGALTAGYEATFCTTFNIGTPATISVDGLTAKPLRRLPNVELLADQFKAGVPVRMSYFTSNSGEWLTGSYRATAVKTQVITTTATTYTPTSGMSYCVVEAVGGGGAGGGSTANNAVNFAAAGGGGGTYSRMTISATSITSSQVATVGAAGAASGGSSGGDGGASSLGSLVTAAGGVGGTKASTLTPGTGGTGGTTGNGDFSIAGQAGTGAPFYATNSTASGAGGSSKLGIGGVAVTIGTTTATMTGNAGTGYGAGGSGTAAHFTAVTGTGGAGRAGVIIITEYF